MITTPHRAGQEELERFYGIPADRTLLLPHPTPSSVLRTTDDSGADVLQKFSLTPGYQFYPAQPWAPESHVARLNAPRLLRDEHGVAVRLVFAGPDEGNRKHVEHIASSLRLTGRLRALGSARDVNSVPTSQALVYLTYFARENPALITVRPRLFCDCLRCQRSERAGG